MEGYANFASTMWGLIGALVLFVVFVYITKLYSPNKDKQMVELFLKTRQCSAKEFFEQADKWYESKYTGIAHPDPEDELYRYNSEIHYEQSSFVRLFLKSELQKDWDSWDSEENK
jgi:hypothetical protein